MTAAAAQGHGRPTKHKPEIILNRFHTRLGTRVGRLLASLFPQAPQFRGRQVATFHNQRDFIFFRRAPVTGAHIPAITADSWPCMAYGCSDLVLRRHQLVGPSQQHA